MTSYERFHSYISEIVRSRAGEPGRDTLPFDPGAVCAHHFRSHYLDPRSLGHVPGREAVMKCVRCGEVRELDWAQVGARKAAG